MNMRLVLVVGAWILGAVMGGPWFENKKLLASDAFGRDYFGYSISISGDYAIVGAYGNDDTGTDSRSAYVYYRNQGGSDNWGEVKHLHASDAFGGDYFGRSVSISGDYAIVGAYGNDDNGTDSGSAYVYYRNQGGSDNWGEVKHLRASDAFGNDYFGLSVSISGDYAIVGAYGNDDNGTDSGSAYVYYRNQGGSDNWGEVKHLRASDAFGNDRFGYSVSISGDYAIVGAYRNDDNGTNSGSAYVYYLTGGRNPYEVFSCSAKTGHGLGQHDSARLWVESVMQRCAMRRGTGLAAGRTSSSLASVVTTVEPPQREDVLRHWLEACREDGEDEAFLEALASCTLQEWDHRTHIRVAYLLLKKHGIRGSVGSTAILSAIQKFIAHGDPHVVSRRKFHVTLTYFWITMVRCAMLGAPAVDMLGDVLVFAPQLTQGDLWRNFYSDDTMMRNPVARAEFVPPDKALLPYRV